MAYALLHVLSNVSDDLKCLNWIKTLCFGITIKVYIYTIGRINMGLRTRSRKPHQSYFTGPGAHWGIIIHRTRLIQ